MVVAAGPEGLTALDAGTGEPRFEAPIGDVQRLAANADVIVAATPTGSWSSTPARVRSGGERRRWVRCWCRRS